MCGCAAHHLLGQFLGVEMYCPACPACPGLHLLLLCCLCGDRKLKCSLTWTSYWGFSPSPCSLTCPSKGASQDVGWDRLQLWPVLPELDAPVEGCPGILSGSGTTQEIPHYKWARMLVLSRIELIFLQVSGRVLCFVLRMKIMLITQWCCNCCRAVLTRKKERKKERKKWFFFVGSFCCCCVVVFFFWF